MPVDAERNGRVLVLRLGNAPSHLIDRRLVDELTMVVRRVARDRSVGSLVLTGALPGRFLTHYEIGEMLAGADAVGLPLAPASASVSSKAVRALTALPGGRRLVRRTPVAGVGDLHATAGLFRRLELLDKVVIAAINGPALGAACELALACDLRYAADDVEAIGSPELTQAYAPGAGGTQRHARALGQARALELVLEGRTPDAREALALGLVHRVVPAGRLLDEAVETAQRLARRSAVSVAGVKRALHEGASLPLDAGLALERSWFMAASSKPPARRAMRAYLDELARAGRGPWEDASTFAAWRDGTAVDLLAGSMG